MRNLPGYIPVIGLALGGVTYFFTGAFHWGYLAALVSIFALYFRSERSYK